MASAVDSRLAYARLSAVATASRLPTANRGSNNSYTTSWDTTPDQGTGLGLVLSNDIVRQHGGEIRVESRPGAFTEMVVALPLVPPTATAQGGEPASRPETSAPPPGSHGSE